MENNMTFWVIDAGETILDKYESLYVKLIEITNFMLRKGASEESLELILPENIFNIFAGCYAAFSEEQYEKSNGRTYLGRLNNRWKLYVDDNIPEDKIKIESNIDNAVLLIANK